MQNLAPIGTSTKKKVEFEATAATVLQNQDGTINANVASNGYPGNKIL